MGAHSGTNIIRKGLVHHIDLDHDDCYSGPPATNLCPTNKQYPNGLKYTGTGYQYWNNYTTWAASGVADQDYIHITGEMRVSYSRHNNSGQSRMYIWTASTTDGWIRSTSTGTTSYKWVPFHLKLQRRDSADTSSSGNTGNGDPLYVRFGCYHYPNSNNYGSSYLRNIMIYAGDANTPRLSFTSGTRDNTITDLKGNKNLSFNNFTRSSNRRFKGRKSRIVGKYQPSFTSSSYMPITSWPSGLNVNDNTTPRSWEIICRPTSTNANQGLYGHKVGAGCSYYCNGGLYIFDSKFAFNWYDNSSYRWLDSGVNPTENNWYHVIGTFSSDRKPRIYVNGELKATYGSATNLNYSSGMLYVEAGYNSKSGVNHPYSGELPVMKFYKGTALSADQVRINYGAYKAKYGI